MHTCAYVYQDGSGCPCSVNGEGPLCFWHDPDIPKEGEDIRRRLEKLARSGQSLEGFELGRSHLEGIRLSDQDGLNLRNANLLRSSLQGASMFNIDLRGARLLKANLSGANLNHARMQEADLLRAVLEGTRLERVEWGESVLQEKKARRAEKAGRRGEARVLFEEAEEIYRSLRRSYDGVGDFESAGYFFQKEMRMRRALMPRWSLARLWSYLVDLFCGYGESPPRVIGFSALLVLCCAAVYFGIGVSGPGGSLRFDPHADPAQNVQHFLNCIYYSIVTFTTLGYGDITPAGIARPIAAFEAFAGAFMMALFITVFGKKMTR